MAHREPELAGFGVRWRRRLSSWPKQLGIAVGGRNRDEIGAFLQKVWDELRRRSLRVVGTTLSTSSHAELRKVAHADERAALRLVVSSSASRGVDDVG